MSSYTNISTSRKQGEQQLVKGDNEIILSFKNLQQLELMNERLEAGRLGPFVFQIESVETLHIILASKKCFVSSACFWM